MYFGQTLYHETTVVFFWLLEGLFRIVLLRTVFSSTIDLNVRLSPFTLNAMTLLSFPYIGTRMSLFRSRNTALSLHFATPFLMLSFWVISTLIIESEAVTVLMRRIPSSLLRHWIHLSLVTMVLPLF